MSSKKKGSASGSSGKRGKRYTTAQKLKVVKFVKDYNAKHGRGGQSRAAKKFNISQLTVASWLRSPIIESSGNKPKGGKSYPANIPLNKKVRDLLEVTDQLQKLESESAKLRAKYESIKVSIVGDL